MPRLDALDQLDALEVARVAPVAAFSRLRSPRRGRFVRSARKATGRARRAFKEDGPGHRLMDALDGKPYFFTLTPADLDAGLSDDPSGLYVDTVSALLDAVARAFRGPLYAVAEVGKGSDGRRGRLHVHCVAHREDGPAHVRRDTKRCQPVFDVFGLYKYLAKPPEPYSLAAELDAAAGRVMSASGRLPNTRRHLLSPERLAWAAAQCPKNQTPQHDPNTAPREPQHGDLADLGDRKPRDLARRPAKRHSASRAPLRPARPFLSEPLPKTRTSVERSGADSAGAERRQDPNARAVLDSLDRRLASERAAASTSTSPTPRPLAERKTPMSDEYLAVKLLELEGLADGLDPDLSEVRAARRLARTLRDPRLAPLRRRHLLFDARNLEGRLRSLSTKGRPHD